MEKFSNYELLWIEFAFDGRSPQLPPPQILISWIIGRRVKGAFIAKWNVFMVDPLFHFLAFALEYTHTCTLHTNNRPHTFTLSTSPFSALHDCSLPSSKLKKKYQMKKINGFVDKLQAHAEAQHFISSGRNFIRNHCNEFPFPPVLHLVPNFILKQW